MVYVDTCTWYIVHCTLYIHECPMHTIPVIESTGNNHKFQETTWCVNTRKQRVLHVFLYRNAQLISIFT